MVLWVKTCKSSDRFGKMRYKTYTQTQSNNKSKADRAHRWCWNASMPDVGKLLAMVALKLSQKLLLSVSTHMKKTLIYGIHRLWSWIPLRVYQQNSNLATNTYAFITAQAVFSAYSAIQNKINSTKTRERGRWREIERKNTSKTFLWLFHKIYNADLKFMRPFQLW